MQFRKKHIAIFKAILDKGYYKPAYSDQEPATKTLEKAGLVEWRSDYKGVKFTEEGKEVAIKLIWSKDNS